MFTDNSQSSLLQTYISVCHLLLFIFWKLEKNWIFLLHPVSGKRGPLTLPVAGSHSANELESASGLQSEAGLTLCSRVDVQFNTHTRTSFCVSGFFLFRCYTIPVFVKDSLYWEIAIFRDAQKAVLESFLVVNLIT